MRPRQPFSLLFTIFLASFARAADVEIRPAGGSSGLAPKALGTTAAPLRLPGGDLSPALSIPAGADLKTFDGALGAVQVPVSQVLGRPAQTPEVLIRALAQPVLPAAQTPRGFAAEEARPTAQVSAAEQGPSAKAELDDAGAQTTQEEAAPAEELGVRGAKEFDGAKPAASAETPAPAAGTDGIARRAGRTLSRAAARLLPKKLVEKVKARQAQAAADKDPYGGPKAISLDFKGKVSYGFKWAMNLIGLQALLAFGAKAFEHVFAWQLHVSDAFLQSTGRVELLARVGPKALGAALTKDPWHFLFVQLPMATAWEEITGRLLGFGVLWTVLAAIKPLTAAVSKWLENVPDLFNLRNMAQTGLNLAGRISNRAFPVAAALSAASFASSHFAAWGINPYFLSVHLASGFTLAYIAYKTRSLLVPVVAHYIFDALTLGAGVIALHFLSPVAAQIYSLLLGTAGIAYLYLNIRSAMKARAEGKAQTKQSLLARSGKAALPVLLAAVLAGSLLSPAVKTDPSANATAAAQAEKIWRAEIPAGAVPTAVPSQTGPAGATPESMQELTVAITAQAKPAVVKIFSGHGLGSGYVVTAQGLTISNAHVTGDAKAGDVLKVEFSDGSTGELKVLAVNHDKDIALLQLPENAKGWAFIALGDSKELVEGQQVLAMGYPLGLPFTVTRGIVSGLGGGRGSIYVQQLQTDAAINHGNSGGPLLNMKGEVVGMNTAIASPTKESGSIGIGFSIVSEDIKAALSQYAAAGSINTAAFGIIVDRANPEAPEQGVLVEKVRPGSAAALAGIKEGDLLLGVDGRRFPKGPHGLELLARAIAQHKPGEELSVLVARGGDVTPMKVKLQDEKP